MDKLSELSKPAAFIVRSPLGDVAYRTISQTDADYIARKGYVSEPLYSQEYVSALLAELEAKDKRIGELEVIATEYAGKFQKAQDAAKHLIIMNDKDKKRIAELEVEVKVWESAATKHLARAEEAEQRIAELSDLEAHNECLLKKNADLTQQNIKLGERLATPVRLPKRWDVSGQVNPPRIVEVQFEQQNRTLDQCTEAIRAAGFTVEGDE